MNAPPNKDSTRTCSVCGTPDLTAECPVCAEAWENRPDASTMTPEERLEAFRAIPDTLEIEFPKIHQWIEELVGRPVWTHELGSSGMAYLEHEILSGERPSLEGVMAKFPHDMPVIPVVVDE